MAKATAECTCKKCGASFTRTAIKRNRRDASDWEHWAVSFFDLCADCYRAEQIEIFERMKRERGIPAIEGVSAKQTDYAERMRRDYALAHPDKLDEVASLLHNLDRSALTAIAAERGISEDQALKNAFDEMLLLKAYTTLTCSDARLIIDVLKGA